jgi:hypothetical protein
VLDKPFRDVVVVTRSISGHATDTIQRHYSTVSGPEQREGLGRVLALIERGDLQQRLANAVRGGEARKIWWALQDLNL